MKDYSRGRHTIFYHRYHLVWITKYRYRVMNYEIKKRVREDEVINDYINHHGEGKEPQNVSRIRLE